jgi:SAM-dependent methyltransferase
VEADVQVAAFADAPFDAVFSRFGVMFFADTVAAFANVRAMLKPGGTFGYVAWGSPKENLFMRLPIDQAAPFLPPRPPFDPNAPGPYRLADAAVNSAFLTDAGFTDIRIERQDAPIGGLAVEEALVVALKVGPLGAALRENPERAPAVIDALKELLNTYRDADGRVFMPAVTWIVTARRPM